MSDFKKLLKKINSDVEKSLDKLEIHFSNLDEQSVRDLFEAPFTQARNTLGDSDMSKLFESFYNVDKPLFEKFNEYVVVLTIIELSLSVPYEDTLEVEPLEDVEGFSLESVKKYVSGVLLKTPLDGEELKGLLESANSRTVNHLSRELADYIFDYSYELGSYANSAAVANEYFNIMRYLRNVPF